MTVPKPWTLPLIVVALIVPIAVGFVVFGPQGMVLAAVLVGVALVIVVSRPRRGRPIEDALREYPADEVLVVAGKGADGDLTSELRRRLDRPVEAMAPGERHGP